MDPSARSARCPVLRRSVSPADARLFVYGTLELSEVMLAVTGQTFESEEAILDGYARGLLRGEEFPGIVPDSDARTRGILYRGIDSLSLRRLYISDRREV